MNTFSRFPSRLQHAIVSRLGWSSLRPVQEMAGAAIMDGKNAIILAPTAGGKTEASVFPVLANLIRDEPEQVGAVYVAPIKALLNNQEERFGTYTEMVGLRKFVWHGDQMASAKKAFLEEPATFLMTTPESLEVMLLSRRVPVKRLFKDLRVVIVDEVHALAGTDRGAHLMSVLERIAIFASKDLQRIGLSATVGNPDEILDWLQGSSARDGCVVDPPTIPVKRQVKVYLQNTIPEIAQKAAADAEGNKSLFFCQSRALTEAIAERMQFRGTDVFIHHSSVSSEQRQEAEERFNQGRDASIICTSTLELGIDIGDLDLVLQANAPSTVSSFLQRMGRTGRRPGQIANTTFYCEHQEAVIQAIALIELAREGWVESVPPQNRCWPVIVHQILALTLQFGAISSEKIWDQLSLVPDFSSISSKEYRDLINHMIAGDFLFEADGMLSMGERAERIYGRKNFMELYAVFSSPVLYRVFTASKKEVGSLEQQFIDRLVEDMSSFLLGGKAWLVDSVNHEDKTVRVRQAPRGQKPSWGGFMPQLLSLELCQKIKSILIVGDEVSYLDDSSRRVLVAMRDDLGELLEHSGLAIQIDEESTIWWTFAGGQINFTLKYALEILGDWKVAADNFGIRIKHGGVTRDRINEIIRTMEREGFWDHPDVEKEIHQRLPEYRLSKFQVALPRSMATEVVGRYLLDFRGAKAFLERSMGKGRV
ncbi:MAG: DEAD/DEAH box helicase [Deltaproteobacteria bacterium]|nr:DEAD/DEAH box helicase [Deltaproteobacteria bacterium]MCB9488918.1 DEAD/DEAH box helicase [Deltaproteobacteria bacterium]